MTESEVHEVIGRLVFRYPNFPEADIPLWVNGLATTDPTVAREAVNTWCLRHAVWPTVAEINEMVMRMTEGITRGKRVAWKAYAQECRRNGRRPTATYLRPTGTAP